MMHEAWQQHAVERAQQINMQLMPVHEAMFYQRSPAGPKSGAHLLGHCAPDTRLPMTPAEPKTKEVVREAMQGAGLL